nr:unnamed protein product [Callosobruchus analis]
MVLMKKSKPNHRNEVKKTRKQLRKEMRKEKKHKRSLYMNQRKFLKKASSQLNIEQDAIQIEEKTGIKIPKKGTGKQTVCSKLQNVQKQATSEQLQKKDRIRQRLLEKEMSEQRKKKLLEANAEEDRIIRQLEKRLGLNKRKTKSLPKGFKTDGLDYLLELCDPDGIKNAVAAEQTLDAANDDEFVEDFATIIGNPSKELDSEVEEGSLTSEENSEVESILEEEDDMDGTQEDSIDENEDDIDSEGSIDNLSLNDMQKYTDSEDDCQQKSNIKSIKKQALKDKKETGVNNKKRKSSEEQYVIQKKRKTGGSEDEIDPESYESDASVASEMHIKGAAKINADGTWEDIYGRLRAKDGSYVPPALRQENTKQSEKLVRLKKQLKGLLNRLTESNMHSIATTIEDMYMNNSRNHMNESLTSLILDTLVTEIITPERLLIEHIVLLAVLHANVGTEVGAHFLQQVALKLISLYLKLYNFQLFDSKLIYEILKKFCELFDEKCIECILHVLKNVGFNLRKDNPLELKSFIIEVQKKASEASDEDKDNCRVKFMLDILLAIRNNNKGNYVTQLNISLEDLLRADEKDDGSAWSGNKITDQQQTPELTRTDNNYSANILDLARQQHMNTDTRRNIFCVIMSAEDYLDAFNKILHLGLKNQQEREIVNVILHCCLREKKYNPYYSFLAQKFCEYDRKYQGMIKYAVWDKLKSLQNWNQQISNLTKLLTHLFIEKGLVISILKAVEFSELDKVTLRFMRQILIGIMVHKDEEECLQVFMKVSKSDKLKMFRESLRLFIHHFLLKNLKSDSIPEDQKVLLERRARTVEKILSVKDSKW